MLLYPNTFRYFLVATKEVTNAFLVVSDVQTQRVRFRRLDAFFMLFPGSRFRQFFTVEQHVALCVERHVSHIYCARFTFVRAPTVANRPPDLRLPVALAFSVSPCKSARIAMICLVVCV